MALLPTSPFFNRTARAIIGIRQPKGSSGTPTKQPPTFTFNGRIKFNVEKVTDSYANKLSINFYNVNPTTLAILQTQGAFVRIEAGYGGHYPILAVGDVFTSHQARSGPDIILSVECYDGGFALGNAQLNVSFAKGATNRQIAKFVVDELQTNYGIGIGNVQDLPIKTYEKYVVSKTVKEIMDDLCASVKYTWGILDGNLHVIPKLGITNKQAYLLSPESGLIEVPTKDILGPTGGQPMYKFKSLLNAALNPYDGLYVNSHYVPSYGPTGNYYNIYRIVHDGDNFEGPYETEVEAFSNGPE